MATMDVDSSGVEEDWTPEEIQSEMAVRESTASEELAAYFLCKQMSPELAHKYNVHARYTGKSYRKSVNLTFGITYSDKSGLSLQSLFDVLSHA